MLVLSWQAYVWLLKHARAVAYFCVPRANTTPNALLPFTLLLLRSVCQQLTAGFQSVDTSLPAIWQGIKKLDKSAVQDALRKGADPNTQDPAG